MTKIKISFDDASTQDIQIAKLLKKYKLEKNTTFFFPVMPSIVNEPKGRVSLSESQSQEIAPEFEIGSHTITHQLLTRIPLDAAKREIFESRDILQKRYNQEINQFSYPRGYANPDLQKLVQQAGYKSARSTLVGYIHRSENPYFEQTTVHVGCDRKEYAGKNWLEYARYMLALAKKTPDSVYLLFGHGWELTNYPAGLEMFEQLLKELVV